MDIDGVKWMIYNCGTTSTASYDKFIITTESGYLYSEASVACPSGWRLPTDKELEALSVNYSAWTSYKGIIGRWFSGSCPYSTTVNRVFFHVKHEFSTTPLTTGYYWSSTQTNGYGYYTYHKTLEFNSSSVSIEKQDNNDRASVRCVKDE